MKLREFNNKQNKRQKQLVFKILICPEFYVCKEPRQLEIYDQFKLQFTFTSWKNYAKNGHIKKIKLIEDKLKISKIKETLKLWRTTLYLHQLDKNIAEPFCEKSKSNLVKKVFDVFIENVN